MRIAVCDDEQVIRSEIMDLIKKQVSDADITEYRSGEEMLEDRKEFDISFLDIEMGNLSGMDLARHIREQEKKGSRKSVIIFVTGYREYMEAAFDVGAFHYLIKPVDREKFAEVFGRACKEASVLEEQTKKFIHIKHSGTQVKL